MRGWVSYLAGPAASSRSCAGPRPILRRVSYHSSHLLRPLAARSCSRSANIILASRHHGLVGSQCRAEIGCVGASPSQLRPAVKSMASRRRNAPWLSLVLLLLTTRDHAYGDHVTAADMQAGADGVPKVVLLLPQGSAAPECDPHTRAVVQSLAPMVRTTLAPSF